MRRAGLLGHGDGAQPVGGIIPARAGFTPRQGQGAQGGADHPRSRGVYAPHPLPGRLGRGSSPLARGLRRSASTVSTPSGIIPARAGFTPVRSTHRCGCRDHPRSRGVYHPYPGKIENYIGSSPLARGLPRKIRPRPRRRRIIPARAGFTPMLEAMVRAGADHPRSRGVYPDGRVKAIWKDRIIPARAGFTSSSAWGMTDSKDHPRSRGVYPNTPQHRAEEIGSSPLARGLHRAAAAHYGSIRIIPARAGFTRPEVLLGPLPADHPRSRGVYLRILGIPTNPYSTRPRLPSLPT